MYDVKCQVRLAFHIFHEVCGGSIPARVFVLLLLWIFIGGDAREVLDRAAAQTNGSRLTFAVSRGGFAEIAVV